MGIFSRSPRTSSPVPEATAAPAEDVAVPAAPAPQAETTDAAARVGISVSTFQGVGAAAPAAGEGSEPAASAAPAAVTRPAAEAPESREFVPGVRDNALLRAALAELKGEPSSEQVLGIARQLLQGHLFLRVKGDARALLAAGEDLPLMVATQGDQQFVMAFSGGEALQASVREDGDTDTSAMGQPVSAVLRHVLAGPYAGLVLDHSSAPARLVLPRALIEKALADTSPDLTVKTLLASVRTDATPALLVAALADAPLWIAANQGADGQLGVAEAHMSDGERLLELFSHPLEVFALGRKDQPVPVTAVTLAKALARDAGIAGVLLDPAGPWIRLSRDDLAPVLALA